MDEIEEARRKEKRQEFVYFIYALLAFPFLIAFYAFLAIEKITLFGYVLSGFSKSLWLASVLFFGGIATSLLILSLSYLIYISIIAKELSARLHSYKPIVVSSILLIVSFSIFLFLGSVLSSIGANVNNIDLWIHNFTGSRVVVMQFIELFGLFLSIVPLGLAVSTILDAVKLPFKAKAHAAELYINK